MSFSIEFAGGGAASVSEVSEVKVVGLLGRSLELGGWV